MPWAGPRNFGSHFRSFGGPLVAPPCQSPIPRPRFCGTPSGAPLFCDNFAPETYISGRKLVVDSAVPDSVLALSPALCRHSSLRYAGGYQSTTPAQPDLLCRRSLSDCGNALLCPTPDLFFTQCWSCLQCCAATLFCSSPALFFAHCRRYLSCCVPTLPLAVLVFSLLCQHSRARCAKDSARNVHEIVPAMCEREHGVQDQRKCCRCAKNSPRVTRRRALSQC